MIIVLKSQFSAAHFYSQPLWDENKNKQVFGRCYTPYGHGHNYVLEVGFASNAENYLADKNTFQDMLAELTAPLDHEHLNFVIPEFRDKNPTTENIALYFLDKLKNRVSEENISFIRLYEMDNLWTEIQL